jgi:hypothetical protein
MTDTANEIALISDSLELYAERHGDMAPRVYERFFELNLTGSLICYKVNYELYDV